MKRILVTGGAGFIGSNVARALIRKGYEVTILDSLSPQIHGVNPNSSELYLSIKGQCEFINGNVCNRDVWLKALDKKDAVIHLAAETGTGQSMYEISRYVDTNISGTALLLDILANTKQSVQKIIVASSRAIYGEGRYNCPKHGMVYPNARNDKDMHNGVFNPRCPECGDVLEPLSTDESSRIHPTSVYGVTKQVQEQLVLMFGKMTGMPVAAMRYQNVYGPGQSLKNPYTGILSIFSTSMLKNNNIDIYEDGRESRDFVYIDDVAMATVLALESDQIRNDSINIGSGKAISVMEVAQTLRKLYSSKSELFVSGHYRQGDIRHNYADISLANRVLNYSPSIDFQKGLSLFVEWVRTQKVEEDLYEASKEELLKRGLYK